MHFLLSSDWQTVWEYRHVFAKGFVLTLSIASLCFLLSTSIGLISALGKRSRYWWIRLPFQGYIELIRSTPLLVQLLVFYYVIANAIHLNNRYLVGILTLSLFSGAYISEIFRGGFEGVPASQLQSARSLGFTRYQVLVYVILPQAFRSVLPPLAGQLASLIKDSSLLSILGIAEFTYSAQLVNSATYSTFECYIPLAIGYFCLTYPISYTSKWLERKFRYEA